MQFNRIDQEILSLLHLPQDILQELTQPRSYEHTCDALECLKIIVRKRRRHLAVTYRPDKVVYLDPTSPISKSTKGKIQKINELCDMFLNLEVQKSEFLPQKMSLRTTYSTDTVATTSYSYPSFRYTHDAL